MHLRIIILVFIVLAAAANGIAASAVGTMTISGTLAGELTLTVQSAFGSTSGLGTSSASAGLGTISRSGGTVPANMTRTTQTTYWTLSSNFSVKVVKSNTTSNSYNLSTTLISTPISGVTWKVNDAELSDFPIMPVLASSYGTTNSLTFALVINNAMTGPISGTIGLTAVAN